MRTAIPVNQTILKESINFAEKNGPLKNRSELHEKVANIYNSHNMIEKEITSSVVFLRIKEWDLEVKTPKGKRGRQPGQKMPKGISVNREAKSETFKKSVIAQEVIKSLYKKTPQKLHHLVKKISNGSRKAAMRLHCLECVGYEYSEVVNCTATTCPVFLFREAAKKDIK